MTEAPFTVKIELSRNNQKQEKGALIMSQENNTTKKIKVQVNSSYHIPPNLIVKLQRQGADYAVERANEKETRPHVKKLSAKEYLVLKTGEIKEYDKPNIEKTNGNLGRMFERLRALIRTNFDGKGKNQIMLTLTYKKNMQDPEQLYNDFKLFWKRFKYFRQSYAGDSDDLEYIAVSEPQGRGAWHMHVLVKTHPDKDAFTPHDKVLKMWRDVIKDDGGAYLKYLKSGDTGSYYVAYFTDTMSHKKDEQEDLEFNERYEKDKEKLRSKKRIKGERLKYYPINMKFYRRTKGIIEPSDEQTIHNKVEKEFGQPRFVRSYSLIDLEQNKTLNTMNKLTYKREGEETE